MQNGTIQESIKLRHSLTPAVLHDALQIDMSIQILMYGPIPQPIELLIRRTIPEILIEFAIGEACQLSEEIRVNFESYVDDEKQEKGYWNGELADELPESESAAQLKDRNNVFGVDDVTGDQTDCEAECISNEVEVINSFLHSVL